jgi:2-iminobutanoate/2-iminopropanoate deaminase
VTQRKQIIAPPGLAATNQLGFAQCVVAGELVFVAGQTGIDAEWNVVGLDFTSQAKQVLENLGLALEAAGSSLQDIVTMTCFFADPRHVREFSELRQQAMGGSLCASTAICGASFVIPGLLLEVEATAVRSQMVDGEVAPSHLIH